MATETEECFILDKCFSDNKIEASLKTKWMQLHDTANVFRYRLKVQQQKFLPGELNFYSELNPDRSALRRVPQSINSLDPTFDPSAFHFNKVNPQEKLFQIKFKDFQVSMIINQSPLTKYHCLICPQLEENHPQKITMEGILFSIRILQVLKDKWFRIGYNSPGALASVNHLHLHLLHVEQTLFIEKADLENLANGIFKLDKKYPIQAICFVLQVEHDELEEEKLAQTIYKTTKILCDEGIPHNLFFTNQSKDNAGPMKVFIFARAKPCIVKDVSALNLAFCELSGYIPVGDPKIFKDLSETSIVSKISNEAGDIYDMIFDKLKNTFK